jgi:hypothetical protein
LRLTTERKALLTAHRAAAAFRAKIGAAIVPYRFGHAFMFCEISCCIPSGSSATANREVPYKYMKGILGDLRYYHFNYLKSSSLEPTYPIHSSLPHFQLYVLLKHLVRRGADVTEHFPIYRHQQQHFMEAI